MKNPRVYKAILVAPLSAYPMFVIPTLFLEPSWALLTPLVGFLAVVVSYLGMLVIGIPSISLLVYLRATRWWHLTLAGALGGACMWCVTGKEIISLGSIVAAAFGVVVAGTTWHIAFRPVLPETEMSFHNRA